MTLSDNLEKDLDRVSRYRATAGVNDFAIRFANVNGTGSASANNLLLKSIFRMGVPVSGKNLFPSNIQGLPTWYELRVNGKGHTARASEFDLVVAMNGQTYKDDVASLKSGGYLLYDSSWPLPKELMRQDVNILGVPLSNLCTEPFPEAKERVLLRNIAYAGAVSALLDLDHQIVSQMLDEKYKKNERLRSSNQIALKIGYDYAKANFDCPLPIRVEPLGANANKILIDGNTTAALGCVYAGATVAGWYPITPATSVAENFLKLCERYRTYQVTLPDGTVETKRNFAVLQAEDEIAAIGMVVGAAWAGARSFTSTSGPGISLMNEIIGLAYYTEIPAVIINVQRTGPSTGMPTRVQQADLMTCAYASHGDTKHILLFPADPNECFSFATKAFDLAEHFQTPVMMLSDLDIGMNDWVVDRLEWDDNYVWDRGRVLTSEQLAELPKFLRYSDPDDDYVTSRTLPGKDSKGAYFTRGSGHDRFGGYTESPEAYQDVVDRLTKKLQRAASYVPEPIIKSKPGSNLGVITIGSCEAAVLEALEILEEGGVSLDYMRLRGFPFDQSVRKFIDDHENCIVVEQNRDAQLRSLLILDLGVDPNLLRSVLSYGGFPLSTKTVVEGIEDLIKD